MPDHPPEVPRRRHTASSAADTPKPFLRRWTYNSNASSHASRSHATTQERYPTYKLTWEALGGYLEGIWPNWKADRANGRQDDRKKIAALRDSKPLARRSSTSEDEE
ncbi:unnamed protein product [Clonostachys byssicola]|uniref:Uncharacterized protein n=1 Tax=Clonostachys byssicola TaxID=160290 RepID=A0A9N9YA97_9HYPO|nr:unnamed protein product [Clonostachys byssicola]